MTRYFYLTLTFDPMTWSLYVQETTAREVVMLALKEFGITEPSSNYSLCEVTVEEENFIKQKRLPDQLSNLPDRSSLNGR